MINAAALRPRSPQVLTLTVVLALLAGWLISSAAPARAQGYVVNTLGDPAGAGCASAQAFQGSLRQCVTTANAAGGINTITFTVAGKLTLTRGELVVSGENLTVSGPGARALAVDGNANSGIFNVSSGATLHVDDLTLQNGSEPSRAGGAIVSTGILTVNRATFKGNNAAGAGAIFARIAAVSTTITNTTFTDNHAIGNFVGVMEQDGGTTSMTNITATGNSGLNGYPAFANCAGTWTITNSTISTNTSPGPQGALASCNTQKFIVTNTVIANNSVNCKAGVVTDLGHNLDSANTCGFTAGPSKFDQVNTNPMLGALANNGGPTDTRALLAGSPAIDAGTNTGCPSADQRGVTRIVSGDPTCDIGAYEYAVPIITGTSPSSGPAVCGIQVTITGSRLNATTGVKFGTTAATNLAVSSDTRATVTCPPGTGTVDVTATSASGTSATSAADQFVYSAVTASPSPSPTPALPKAGSGSGGSPGVAQAWIVAGILVLAASAVLTSRRLAS